MEWLVEVIFDFDEIWVDWLEGLEGICCFVCCYLWWDLELVVFILFEWVCIGWFGLMFFDLCVGKC